MSNVEAPIQGMQDPRLILKMKQADETKNSDTTFATDGDLQFEGKPNTSYHVEIFVYFNSDAAADFKWHIEHPAGASGAYIAGDWNAVVESLADPLSTASEFVTTDTDEEVIALQFFVQIGATGGTVGLQWAQNTSNAADTIVRKGSSLKAYELPSA